MRKRDRLFFELGNQIQIPTGQIFGNLGTLYQIIMVASHHYLGVTISSDLNWLRHVTKISNKASRTLGLLKRTLSPCSQDVKSIAYKMLVRPQLEYASEVWNPYTMKCTKKIEQIP